MMDRDGAQRPGSGIGDSRALLGVLVAALLLLAALQAGGEAWRDALRFERGAVLDGEAWRLLTAHFVHFDLRHMAYDAAGLVLLWGLFAREWTPWQWLAIAVVAIAAIDAGLWWQRPAVQWYLGASGVLHGVWSAGAWQRFRRERGWGALPLLALVAKLAIEQGRGGSLFVGDMPVLLNSHLYGALGGLFAAIVLRTIGARMARPL